MQETQTDIPPAKLQEVLDIYAMQHWTIVSKTQAQPPDGNWTVVAESPAPATGGIPAGGPPAGVTVAVNVNGWVVVIGLAEVVRVVALGLPPPTTCVTVLEEFGL